MSTVQGQDVGSYVADARQAVADQVKLPAGLLDRLVRRLRTLGESQGAALAGGALHPGDHSGAAVPQLPHPDGDLFIILATLPLGLVGGFWLMYFLGYQLSVASVIGFIALAGVAVEIGVVMLLYLDRALAAAARAKRESRR